MIVRGDCIARAACLSGFVPPTASDLLLLLLLLLRRRRHVPILLLLRRHLLRVPILPLLLRSDIAVLRATCCSCSLSPAMCRRVWPLVA